MFLSGEIINDIKLNDFNILIIYLSNEQKWIEFDDIIKILDNISLILVIWKGASFLEEDIDLKIVELGLIEKWILTISNEKISELSDEITMIHTMDFWIKNKICMMFDENNYE